MGIGTTTPPGKLVVKGDASLADTIPLFEVKDRTGATVFVVYPDSVRVFVCDDGSKTNKGAFAVSGRNTAKQVTHDFFTVTPDSVRVFLDSASSMGGFAVKSFGSGLDKDFMSVYVDTDQVINPSVSRMLWYPSKEAFLSGRVLIQSPDSVGTNSWATGYEAKAVGDWSQSLGYSTVSRGNYSTAIGRNSVAHGESSFAFGNGATSEAIESYAFGSGAIASGIGSYALGSQGIDTVSGMPNSIYTRSTGMYSFAIGQGSQATNLGSMCFGLSNNASGQYSLSMGAYSGATGSFSTAIGTGSYANAQNSIAVGIGTQANSVQSSAFGSYSIADGYSSTALGFMSHTTGPISFAFGYFCLASGSNSLAEGYQATASGPSSLSLGNTTTASAISSVAIGQYAISSGNGAIAIGSGDEATGEYSSAIGYYSKSTGIYSTSVGLMSVSAGDYSVAIGTRDTAVGYSSLALGLQTKAIGSFSTTVGRSSIAVGDISFASGFYTKAKPYCSFVVGQYNDTTCFATNYWSVIDPLFIVGNGTSDNARSNAMMVQKDGEIYFPFVYNEPVGAINRDLYIDDQGKIGYLSSSEIFKKDITNMEDVSWLYRLRPVNYTYKKDVNNRKEYGLIAEEVEKVNPLFVSYNANGSVETVNYSKLVTPLLKALQDQKTLIDQQQKQIDILLQSNSVMQSEINDLKKNLVQK